MDGSDLFPTFITVYRAHYTDHPNQIDCSSLHNLTKRKVIFQPRLLKFTLETIRKYNASNIWQTANTHVCSHYFIVVKFKVLWAFMWILFRIKTKNFIVSNRQPQSLTHQRLTHQHFTLAMSEWNVSPNISISATLTSKLSFTDNTDSL